MGSATLLSTRSPGTFALGSFPRSSCSVGWFLLNDPDRALRRALEYQREGERQLAACKRFEEARTKQSRRVAVRAMVRSAQQLNAAAPRALYIWRTRGSGKNYGFRRFVDDVREDRLGLQLNAAQLAVFDQWADATLKALADGVAEGLLHALIAKLDRRGVIGASSRRFSRAVSLQLRSLAHSIARHAPPFAVSAEPRSVVRPPAEVMTAA
jgi:hypothetical protein